MKEAVAQRTATRFITMGISKVSDVEACVGAITQDGGWVRPETPTMDDIRAAGSPFAYFRWATADLGDSMEHDPRLEDHHMLHAPLAGETLSDSVRLQFLETHADSDVETGFSGERTLALVNVTVRRFYMKQSTRGRTFLRCEFADAKGDVYDWIVTEVKLPEMVAPHLNDGEIEAEFSRKLMEIFNSAKTFFVIALTKPNNRFPGKFRGGHPVVIGIHTVPDYSSQLLKLHDGNGSQSTGD